MLADSLRRRGSNDRSIDKTKLQIYSIDAVDQTVPDPDRGVDMPRANISCTYVTKSRASLKREIRYPTYNLSSTVILVITVRRTGLVRFALGLG